MQNKNTIKDSFYLWSFPSPASIAHQVKNLKSQFNIWLNEKLEKAKKPSDKNSIIFWKFTEK